MSKVITILSFLFTVISHNADTAPKPAADPFKLENDADLVIYYHPDHDDRAMEISSGPRKNDKARVIIRKERFSKTSKSLVKYFNDQPRKQLIVIVFEFNKLEEAECMAKATTLKDYFAARGYRRISIQQATNGGSRPVYVDYTAEPKMAVQPAARPADNTTKKDKPSSPTTKDQPR